MTTATYSLSLHDALPIYSVGIPVGIGLDNGGILPATVNAFLTQLTENPRPATTTTGNAANFACSANTVPRSEEHTSELQSRLHLVCRLLLEKKNWSICLF